MSLKAELNSRGLAPRKKWGQHFLTDARILASIADAAELSSDDWVLEIGPGLGHLTRVLATRAHVVAVEVDRGLAEKLQAEFAATGNVQIICGDALEQEPLEWIRAANPTRAVTDFQVVANLPYYITSALLRHFLEAKIKPRRIVATVQREVAERMIAQPPQMSLLALSVQYFAQPRRVRKIAAGAFYPRPAVESAVVRLDVLDPPRGTPEQAQQFFEIARAGFSGRRKQLRNSLARLFSDDQAADRALARAGIDPKRRAETLALSEWQALARAIANLAAPAESKAMSWN